MAAKSYSSREKQSQRSKPDKFKALIEISESADLVYKAISPKGVERQRSVYSLKRTKESLVIEISASDMVAFKATMNSLMRQIELSLKL